MNSVANISPGRALDVSSPGGALDVSSPGGALDVSPGQAKRSPGKAPQIVPQPRRGAGDHSHCGPFIGSEAEGPALI